MKPASTDIWLVRHAQSLFNLWDLYHQNPRLAESLSPSEASFVRSIKSKHDAELMDPPLSQEGIRQAVAAQSAINKIPAKYVIVSPLHRTLETARLLFDTHPNKSDIEFIVLPIIREVLNNPDDIPVWNLKYYKEAYPSYDFSLLEREPRPDTFFLDTMDPDINEKVTALIRKEGVDKYPEIMLKCMKEKWEDGVTHHRKLETFGNGRKRCVEFAKWMMAFLKEHKLRPQEVVVVTHSVFLKCLIAKEFNDYGKPVWPDPIINAAPFTFDIESLLEGSEADSADEPEGEAE